MERRDAKVEPRSGNGDSGEESNQPVLSDPRELIFRHLSLGDLQTTLAVAERGSFRRAAERLCVGQSVVSRRVQKLEDELGVSLFERNSSGASLTVAGHEFVCSSRAVLQQVQVAITDARSAGIGAKGRLRIGLAKSLSGTALRDIVKAFATQHPDVELSFAEGDRSDLLTRLSHRRMDAVFLWGEPLQGDPDMMLVSREQLCLALTAEGPTARAECLSWKAVAEETFLTSNDEPGAEIHDHILRHARDLGRELTVRRIDLGREGIMTLVGLGFGVSLTAGHWRGMSYPGVILVPFSGTEDRLPVSLTWRPENDNPALRRFLSLARIHARRALSTSAPS